MNIETQKILVLLTFAVVLAGINLKTNTVVWLKWVTLYSMVVCLIGAGWQVVTWMWI